MYESDVPSVRDYILCMLIAMIPIVGMIIMIIWAFGNTNIPLWKVNYAKAYLVFTLIVIVASFTFSFVMGALFIGLLSSIF